MKKQQHNRLQSMFKRYDKDQSGSLSIAEIGLLFKELGRLLY